MQVLLCAMPVAMGAFRGNVPKLLCGPQILFRLEKFVLSICCNKNKNLAPLTVYLPSKPQKLATGLLYTSLHFQNLWLLTALSQQMLVISVHISFCS